MKQHASEYSKEEFEAIYDGETFEVDLDGKTMIELCDGGAGIKLSNHNIDDYCRLFLDKYSELDKLQFKMLCEGVDYVCGKSIIPFLSSQIACRRASSSSSISWRELKAVAIWDNKSEDEELVKMNEWIWRMIKEMSNSDRILLLKFWTGRNRIV